MSFAGSLLKVVAIGAFFASQFVAPGLANTLLVIGGYIAGTVGSIIDAPHLVYETQVSAMRVEPRTPIPVVYGRAKVGSQLVDWFIDPDYADAKILYQIVSLCHGSRDGRGIEKVEEIWFNDRKAITNPTSGELAESGGNDVREHPWGLSGVDYQIFLGTSTQNVGGTDLKGLARTNDPGDHSPGDITDSGWSNSTDTGKGIAAISFRLIPVLAYVTAGGGNDKAKAPIFSGPPSVGAIVLGNFVEDPRAAINVSGQPVTAINVTLANVGAADTITIAAGAVFNTWKAGDRVAISGSSSNNGIYTIASVAASVLTLTAADSLVNEGPSSSIVLKRWAAPSNGGDNPALCIRDYLLSTTYGWGLDSSMIDEASFRDAADYCDMLIDYPLTAAVEQATRYTCNGVVDTGQEVGSNLDRLCSSCRGGIDWSQGKARLIIRGMLNLIENSTFEANIDGTEGASGSETLVYSTAQAHSGIGSCKVTTVNAAFSGIRMARVRFATEPLEDGWALTVGRSYTTTAYVYATGGTIGKTLRLQFHWTNGLGSPVGTDPFQDLVLVSGWNAMTVTGTVPAGTISTELAISTGVAAQGVFDFYVDDWTMGPDPVLALTPLNIVGQWSFRNAGNADRWNLVKATYIDPLNGEHKALETQWPPQGSNSYLTADNAFLNRLELPLPFTNDQPIAQSIAQITLNEARNGITCQVVCTEEALIATVGDRVTVTHPTPGWTVKPFWVTAIELRADTTVALTLMEHQSTAYDLATMEDRRDYPATDHVPTETEPGNDLTISYGVFIPSTWSLPWDVSTGNYARPTLADGTPYGVLTHLDETQLPDGAIIVSEAAHYYLGNASAGSAGIICDLWKVPNDGSAVSSIVQFVNDTTETNAWQTHTTTTAQTIDWSANHYFLTVVIFANGAVNNCRFMWVRLNWRKPT